MIKVKENGQYSNIEDIKIENVLTGTSPMVFQGTSGAINNYRIYGASNGVGDLITDESDDNYGKYIIPIMIEGKNVAQATGKPSTIKGVRWEYRSDGAVTGTRISANENVSDFTYFYDVTIPAGSYIFSYADSESSPSGSTYQASISVNGQNRWRTTDYPFTINEPAIVRIVLRVYPAFNGTAVFKPMIRRSVVTDRSFVKYQSSMTASIYLDEPLAENEYIDFHKQKLYSGNVSNKLYVPRMPILSGINVFIVDTAIKPSNILIEPVVKSVKSIKDKYNNLLYNKEYQDLMLTSFPEAFSSETTALRTYRIYGNVNGVGDRTVNLFNKQEDYQGQGKFWSSEGVLVNSSDYYGSPVIDVTAGTQITRSYTGTSANYFFSSDLSTAITISESGTQEQGVTLTVPNDCTKFVFNIPNNMSDDEIYVVASSSKPENYEPYGYKIPLVLNGTEYNVYLDRPLVTNDYVDYLTQKRYNHDGTTKTIVMPELTVNDDLNVININTNVKPDMLIRGNVSFFPLNSWANVQRLVRAGLHNKYFSVGASLVCGKDNQDLIWDIIDFDHDTPTDSQLTHSMTLQLRESLPLMQFDSQEALYYAEEGLPAGTYNFTIQSGYDVAYGGGKTYQFTLTKDVPRYGQLIFNWLYNTHVTDTPLVVYEDSYSMQPAETVSVSEGNGGTSLGTTDGNSSNVNHIVRTRYGSNNYKESAIRQFLNSSNAINYVWTPQTKFDRPPTWHSTTAGFMNGIDEDFLAVIGSVEKTVRNAPYSSLEETYVINDKFFLLSRSEIYAGFEDGINEGNPYLYYSLYSDLATAGIDEDSNRIKRIDNVAQRWFLRTPVYSTLYNVKAVQVLGNINNLGTANRAGIVVACNII